MEVDADDARRKICAEKTRPRNCLFLEILGSLILAFFQDGNAQHGTSTLSCESYNLCCFAISSLLSLWQANQIAG